jgi:ABC-2 type transport system ATP-binding protein
MQEIKAICNRVIVINNGDIVADYSDLSKLKVFDENRCHLEVEFANDVKMDLLEKLENVTNIKQTATNHFIVIASCDIRSSLFDFAVETNNKILMIKTLERSMEEVFKSLTN